MQWNSTNQLTLEHIHVTFEGKANLEKNNLQTVQAKRELNLHRVDGLTPKKITIILITLDQAWKTNQAEFFAFDKFMIYFTKSLPTSLGTSKPTF